MGSAESKKPLSVFSSGSVSSAICLPQCRLTLCQLFTCELFITCQLFTCLFNTCQLFTS
jgi:hypothetical protein